MTNVIAPFFFLAVAIGLFFTYIKPGYESVQALQELDARLDNVLGKTKVLREKKEALLTRMNNISKVDREKLSTLIPDRIDTIRVVLDIDTIAAKHGINVKQYRISQDSLQAVPTTEEVSQKPELLASTDVGLVAVGAFSDIQAFLIDVERNVRLMDVKQVSIGVNDAVSETEDLEKYKLEMTIETYWLKADVPKVSTEEEVPVL